MVTNIWANMELATAQGVAMLTNRTWETYVSKGSRAAAAMVMSGMTNSRHRETT